ncbi:MAG: transcription antitermination factor NusB [Anaerolineales bacterium]|nr:transcription antitermination factor NusB [Anaerolineales bacterium]
MNRVHSRRRAREIALQVLYELECTQHAAAEVLAERLGEKPLDPASEAFAQELVTGVLAHRTELDDQIQKHAPEWPLDQMALIDHNILRLALWEFSLGRLTPVKVAINEAVELAKEFGSESAPRFINGVLGSAAAEVAEAPPG